MEGEIERDAHIYANRLQPVEEQNREPTTNNNYLTDCVLPTGVSSSTVSISTDVVDRNRFISATICQPGAVLYVYRVPTAITTVDGIIPFSSWQWIGLLVGRFRGVGHKT